jgi:hypothetical protein
MKISPISRFRLRINILVIATIEAFQQRKSQVFHYSITDPAREGVQL